MDWPKLSIIIFSDADPEGCVRILTDCERLEHENLEFEILLVHQGLTLKVEEMLKDYPFSFDLKHVSIAAGSNRAQGRNLGASMAEHEILLFLDSNLEISPGLLYRHLEAYAQITTAAVMGEIFLPEFVKKSRWLRFMDSNYRSTRRWYGRVGKKNSPPLRYVNTSNFSVRKAVFKACGGHSESIFNDEAENIDLAHRISALKQGTIRYEPEAVAYCQHAPLKEGLKAKFEFGREGIPTLVEYYPDLYPILASRFVKTKGMPTANPLVRGFMTLLFTPPILFIARGIRILGPEFMAFRMFRYMLQYESVRGYKMGLVQSK